MLVKVNYLGCGLATLVTVIMNIIIVIILLIIIILILPTAISAPRDAPRQGADRLGV